MAKLKRAVSLHGIEDMGGIPANGAIARPVTPVLTNLMISFALLLSPILQVNETMHLLTNWEHIIRIAGTDIGVSRAWNRRF